MSESSFSSETLDEIHWLSVKDVPALMPLFEVHEPKIPVAVIEQRIREMFSQGYRCVGTYRNDKLIAMSGVWIMTKYHVGKHVVADHVFVLPQFRGQGIARRMIDFLFSYGEQNDCIAMEIDAYLYNQSAHEFWKSLGFKDIGLHFQKKLIN